MKHLPERTLLDKTFWVSLVLKGLDGVLEVAGAILLLAVSPAQLGTVARMLTQHELREDPTDFVATYLLHATSNLTVGTSLFGAAYLVVHGLVKIVLVWAVLRDKLWAYPWMIAFLLVFIAYQLIVLVSSFSWGLTLLTAFDGFVVWLTWREYGIHRRRRAGAAEPRRE